MSEAEDALNRGLLAGYASDRPPGSKTRGGVEFRVSHPKKLGGGLVYHDEWISGRTGGGQETVVTSDEAYTRVYAGGIVPDQDLGQLGTNRHQVETALSGFLKGSGGKTRLREDYFAVDGNWQYSYVVIEEVIPLGLTAGMERIELKGETVFAHVIATSPINSRS